MDESTRRPQVMGAVIALVIVVVATLIVVGIVRISSVGGGDPARAVVGPPSAHVPRATPNAATRASAPFTGTDLVVVDPETGGATPAFALEGHQWNGERSPDGSRLVYQGRDPSGGRSQIFVLGADGTERRLTDLSGGAADPTWSPDGRRIAFVSPIGSPRDSDVFVMDADGSDIYRLTGTSAPDGSPDWSPDGTRIVFHSNGDDEQTGIWVASVADGAPTRLTSNAEVDGDHAPAWSPDGNWIVFIRFEDAPGHNLEQDDSDLWLMHPDGSDQHRLVVAEGPLRRPLSLDDPSGWGRSSPDDHFQQAPTWSPDGRWVALTGGHCGCIRFVNARTGVISPGVIGDYEDPSWDEEGILVSEQRLVK